MTISDYNRHLASKITGRFERTITKQPPLKGPVGAIPLDQRRHRPPLINRIIHRIIELIGRL